MSKIIVLIGPPGAGKGTQARLLEDGHGIPQISTGDLFREMKNADTPLAREVKETMAAGHLVSDALTFKIVQERTSRDDCRGDYLLDGYPRTAVQAEQLEALASEQGKTIIAVEIHVDRSELMKRLTGRRSCGVCGEIYNIYSKPPVNEGFCDHHPDTKLTHRADDNEESVATRLTTYDQATKPLLDYYRATDRLKSVNGAGAVGEIYQNVIASLDLGN